MYDEIKRLPYTGLKVVLLSSRDKLCINPDIDKSDYTGKLLSQRCMELTSLSKSARLHSYYKQTLIDQNGKLALPEDLQKASTQLKEAKKTVKKDKPCDFYESGCGKKKQHKWDLVDIEDLVKAGKETGACPYYEQ